MSGGEGGRARGSHAARGGARVGATLAGRILLAAGLGLAPPAAAQESGDGARGDGEPAAASEAETTGGGASAARTGTPLRKTDLVRILSGTTYTRAEVAHIVRRNCLAFAPTPQDLGHVRSLGADADVMAAIEECAGRPSPAGRPPVSDAAPPSPRIVRATPARVTVPAGERATVTVRAERGGRPEAGVRLVLRGSGELGGGGPDLSAVTDARGRAVFRVPVLARPGEHELAAVPRGGGGGARVVVAAVAGAPWRASVTPDPIPPPTGREDSVRVRVRLVDAAGNPIPGRQVRLRSGGLAGPPLGTLVTDATGEGETTLAVGALEGTGRVSASVGGRELASVPVSRRRPGVRTRFLAANGSRGEAGRPLPEPLVLEVRDENGSPLARWPVRFRVRNGVARPEVTETDAGGRAAVEVILGEPGRPTEVSAVTGGVERIVVVHPTRGGLAPHEFRAALSEAAALLAADRPARAAAAYLRLLAADPRSADALFGHGRALEALGDTAAAAQRYRAALAISPERRDARFRLERIGREL